MTFAITVTVWLITILLMFAMLPVAHAVGLVDRPGGRKHHVGDIPVIGGVAMFLSVSIGIALIPGNPSDLVLLITSGGLLVLIGVIDDRFSLPASIRLVAQLSAVLILAFGAGRMMTDIGNPLWFGRIELGAAALFITALIFLSVVNAYNTIDGLDGLAGGMALIAALSIAIVAGDGSQERVLALIVAAAVSGYLLFNVPIDKLRPFRAFMGDAGSTFLGLAIVWLTVGLCQGADRVISPVHGLWFAALPLFDFFTCFVRRILARRSPFDPGRDHFHHLLRESGMEVPVVTVTLVSLQLLYAGIGLAGFYSGVSEPLMFTLWAIAGIGQLTLVRGIASVTQHFRGQRQAA